MKGDGALPTPCSAPSADSGVGGGERDIIRAAPRTLCLGEALIDLICPRPATRLADATVFVPHCGGATANVAISAARHGATIALAGATGDDSWGDWLHEQLASSGVDLRWFAKIAGMPTPLACVTVDRGGEPNFSIYGEGISRGLSAIADRIDEAVAACDALFIGSNTLVGATERKITQRARRLALNSGRPVLLDANLRLERWRTRSEAISTTRRAIPGALVVRTNLPEAMALTGCREPGAAARALLDNGAECVVITLGKNGAIARGPVEVDVPGVQAKVVSTVGAGDAFMGALVAALANADYDLEILASALASAVREGARATERWGALER